MGTETLALVLVMIAIFVVSVMVGYAIMLAIFRVFESLVDALSPSTWLTLFIITLVLIAGTCGYVFGNM